MTLETVDYNILDAAKLRFIESSKSTLAFAGRWGAVLNPQLGASANLFALDLGPWISAGAKSISLSLVPEGLGTADDARPADLSSDELTEFWFEIGIKAVAVMTNDAASSGLQTIAVGLYLPSSQPEKVFTKEFLTGFLDGFVEGCKQVGCVYLSGETPQLKSKMLPGKLDIAGALVAIAPPNQATVNSRGVSAGDFIVLVESSGPHENGFTTIRGLAERLPDVYRSAVDESGTPLWRAANRGSKLYTPLVQAILEGGISPTGLENITGHGWQKIMRRDAALRYEILDPLPLPPLFTFLEKELQVERARLLTLFNCGAGFAVFLSSRADAEATVRIAAKFGLCAKIVGQVHPEPHGRRVVVPAWNVELDGAEFALKKG